MLTGWKYLSTTKITAVIKELNGLINQDAALIFLNRTSVVPAADDEIMGRYTGKAYIADIMANDQTTLVYDQSSMTFETTEIPKLKFGRRLSEGMINLLYRLEQGGAVLASDQLQFTNWQNSTAEECLQAIRNRMNQICCAMELDSYTYNRFGMQISAGWGTPANLKPTSANFWDNPTTGTPIADMGAITNQVGPDNYGSNYNRATMSTKAFRYMIATDEVRNLISGTLLFNLSSGNLNLQKENQMRAYVESLSGLVLELYDGTFWERAANGTETQNRVLPSNRVILTNTAHDNNRRVRDFANGIVTETILGSMMKKFGFTGPEYGPVAYWSVRENLDPPDIICYGASRGFARKHDFYSTAALQVGTWS